MAVASPSLSSPMSPIDRSQWNPASRRNQSMDYDMFDDTELAQVRTQLQRFVSQHEDSSSQDFNEGSKAITRLHWINPSKRSRCQNSSCKAKFILKLRKHHCRKCGEVFCARCLSFQRKLSPTAEYDPNGKLFMVCSKCFNSETQGPGQARIWTQTFLEMRRDSLLAHAEAIGETTQKPSRAHLEKECQRLVEGFSMNLTDLPPSQEVRLPQSEGTGKNILMRKLSALKNHVSKVPGLVKIGPPEWKKPITWISAGANCQFCSTAFTMTYKKHNCYICGRLACFSCSVKDLLLYVPDKDDQEHVGKLARWAIIKVIGSPELEPDIRHYVRVCTVCRQALEVVQVENYEASIKGEESEDCLKQMKDLFDNIIKFQDKIDAWLPKYKQLIDALEIAGESPKVLPASRSNMQTLAKHQGDLTDYFTSFVVAVSRLKKLKPQTNKQLKLVKALMRCKFNYYNDNMYTFRKLKRRLEQISPPEVLQAIQSIVDSQVTRRLRTRHTPNQTPRQTPNQTPRQSLSHTPNSTPNETPRHTPNQTPRHTPNQIPKQTHRQMPLQTSLDYDYTDFDSTEIDIDLEESQIGREMPTEYPYHPEEELEVGRDRDNSKGQTPVSTPELNWMWRMVGRVSFTARRPTLMRQMAIDGPERTLESEVVGKADKSQQNENWEMVGPGGNVEGQTDSQTSQEGANLEQTVHGVAKGHDGHTDPHVSQSVTDEQGAGVDVGIDEIDSENQILEHTRKGLLGHIYATRMAGWVSSKVTGSTLSLDKTEKTDSESVDETNHVQEQMESSDSKATEVDKPQENNNLKMVGAGIVEGQTDPQTSQQLANLPGHTGEEGMGGMDEVGSKKWPLVKTFVGFPGQMVGWVHDKRNSLSLDSQEQIDEKGVDKTANIQGQTDPSTSKKTAEPTDEKVVFGRVEIHTDSPTSKQLANQTGQSDDLDSENQTLGKTHKGLAGWVSSTRMVGWVSSQGRKASPNLASQELTDEKGVDGSGVVQNPTGDLLAMQTLADEQGKTDKGKDTQAGNVETHGIPQTSQHVFDNPGQIVEEESSGRDELDSKRPTLKKALTSFPGKVSATKMFGWVNPKGKTTVSKDEQAGERVLVETANHGQTGEKVVVDKGDVKGETDPLDSKSTTAKPGQTDEGKVVGTVNIETNRGPQTSQNSLESEDVPGRDGNNSLSRASPKTRTSLRGKISLTKMFVWGSHEGKNTVSKHGQTGENVVVETDTLDSNLTTDKAEQTVKQEVAGTVSIDIDRESEQEVPEIDSPSQAFTKTRSSLRGKISGTKVFGWVHSKDRNVPNHGQTGEKVDVDKGTVESQIDTLTSKPTTGKQEQAVKREVVGTVNIRKDRAQTSQKISEPEEVPGRESLDSQSRALPKTRSSLRGKISATKMFGWGNHKDRNTVPNHGQSSEKVLVERAIDEEGQSDPLASKQTTEKPGQTSEGEVVGAVKVNGQTEDPLVLRPPKDTSRFVVQGASVGEGEVDSKHPGPLKRFSKQIWATKVFSSGNSKRGIPASHIQTLSDDQQEQSEN